MLIKMLTSQIGTVLKQAVTTFTNKELFFQNMEILKALLDKTTAEDVNLHPQFMTEALWQRPNKAPVTYIDIYEDYNLTIGIFILKPDMKLPLHNHPQMHGLIKVVGGKLKVTSYSLNTEKTRQVDGKAPPGSKFLTAEKCAENLLETHSECCVLEPEVRNLHEIESVGGPAAFIDILAPPYETVIPGNGARKCSYFRVLREVAPSVFRMQEITSPSWYWTDSFPYTGPDLS
ncbi:2-aminoethanethiol dioxygenase [Tribolium castaneum]|nr:PREDICTED: 2-aminoethanethiol dioxygenase [Tribolium castaneum]|eukprot:XP_974899.2 PREDICTED: 2-aminoethanethiol dioxygenase [Tribolium castaneum]